jgi:hypothetical protein
MQEGADACCMIVVAMTRVDPPGETTHWTPAAMAAPGPDQRLLGAAHLALARPRAALDTAVQTVACPGIRSQAA